MTRMSLISPFLWLILSCGLHLQSGEATATHVTVNEIEKHQIIRDISDIASLDFPLDRGALARELAGHDLKNLFDRPLFLRWLIMSNDPPFLEWNLRLMASRSMRDSGPYSATQMAFFLALKGNVKLSSYQLAFGCYLFEFDAFLKSTVQIPERSKE